MLTAKAIAGSTTSAGGAPRTSALLPPPRRAIGNQAALRRLQPRLAIGPVDDPLEREADAAADRVMRMANPAALSSAGPALHRKCAECEEEDRPVLRKTTSGGGGGQAMAPAIVSDALAAPGQAMDSATQAFMTRGFGSDFGDVRIHTDALAQRSAAAVGALAYTVGRDVVFAAGQYAPGTETGRRLLAHELAHTIQQRDGGGIVQRDCTRANACVPYPTAAEADSAKWWLQHTYMYAEGYPSFGPEVESIYRRYLSRAPGASLEPMVFSNPGSYIVRSFMSSWDTKNDMDAVIDLVWERRAQAPGPPLADNRPTMMSLSNFLTEGEMFREINYSNPFSVAGHIAGGIGSSDAGADYRKITYANVTMEKTTLAGSTGYVTVSLTPHYEVFDAVDLCPGDIGSGLEQCITVTMSRLEASGAAYDQPFKVIFVPETRSKRFWF